MAASSCDGSISDQGRMQEASLLQCLGWSAGLVDRAMSPCQFDLAGLIIPLCPSLICLHWLPGLVLAHLGRFTATTSTGPLELETYYICIFTATTTALSALSARLTLLLLLVMMIPRMLYRAYETRHAVIACL